MRRVILEMMALVTAATLTGAPALGAGPDPRPPGEPAAGSTVADHMKRGDAARLSRRTTGIALTATAAVAGAGTLLWSEALTSDIDDRMRGKDPGACLHPDQQCKDVRRMIAQRDALDRIGVVGLSAACGLAGVTLALIILAPDEPEPDGATTRVVPVVGQHAGLLIHGAW